MHGRWSSFHHEHHARLSPTTISWLCSGMIVCFLGIHRAHTTVQLQPCCTPRVCAGGNCTYRIPCSRDCSLEIVRGKHLRAEPLRSSCLKVHASAGLPGGADQRKASSVSSQVTAAVAGSCSIRRRQSSYLRIRAAGDQNQSFDCGIDHRLITGMFTAQTLCWDGPHHL